METKADARLACQSGVSCYLKLTFIIEKELRYNDYMRITIKSLLVIAIIAELGSIVAFAQPPEDLSVYRFDPALSVAEPRLPTISSRPQIVVDQDTKQPRVRLQTETPIVPYLGAERSPELSPEEQRLLGQEQARGPLSNYNLEAGVGLLLEDKTSLNLGYRFHERPSLLDERRNDPLALSGDLRIGFDVKVPF